MLTDSKAVEKLAKKDKGLFNRLKQFITDFFNKIIARYKKLQPTSVEAKLVQQIEGMSSNLQKLFEDALLDAAENQRIVGAQKNTADSGVRYSFEGYAEDGKGKYKSNYPKGTPKKAKGERILHYIQDVWSKNPITLRMEKDGDIRYIEAKFDPDYDPSGNRLTDVSKLMGGNRHGTSSEQRVTLDLADDYYKIASEANYNYSKDETGKDISTHDGVREWHYFVNDIYFSEFENDEYYPYRVTINVKEKSNGHFVYSFSAEKQKETSSQRTLHAVVNGETTAKGNLSNIIVSDSNKGVKQKQLEIIQETNPAPDSYHTWIRSVDDIKTLAETLEDEDWSDGGDFNPDLSSDDIQEAIERGNITVYSSYPIENGVFVTPSRMEAESYSGTGRVYEKTVDIKDVAWIDPTQGQYAKITEDATSVNTKFQLKQKESAYDEAVQEYKKTHSVESVKKMVSLVDEFAERAMPNSKVRDENGKLMKVYHGTEAEDFNVFDKARRGQSDVALWGRGYYFSYDFDFAGMFGSNIRSFFLNITNPFEIHRITSPASEVADKLIAHGEKIDFDYSDMEAYEFVKRLGSQSFTDVLASYGYDGVIVGNFADDYLEYVAFEQNQMKLSDPVTYDDKGEVIPLSERFDDTKTDIRYHKKVDSNAKLTDNKNIKNGGAVNGSKNTELLERGNISAVSRSDDYVWKQSENSQRLSKILGIFDGTFQNYKRVKAGVSGWLGTYGEEQKSRGWRPDKSFLGKLSKLSVAKKDTADRIVPETLRINFQHTALKDDNGCLLSLYHWTNAQFKVFGKGELGYHLGTLAAAHNRSKGEQGYYKECYVNIRKPLVIDFDPMVWNVFATSHLLERQGVITSEEIEYLENLPGYHKSGVEDIATIEFKKILNEKGYDGLIYSNWHEGEFSVLAFYPEQIYTVAENGTVINNYKDSKTQNGLPRGVLNFQLKSYAVETDSQLLAQHLEENSEAVGEILRRSSEIEMNERTMRRTIEKRLREYGIASSLRKETSEYISAVFFAAAHPSAQGKVVDIFLTKCYYF